MFRVSVILSVLLISITAKPWNKEENEGVKRAVVSIDEKGKLTWEAELPEDMRDIQYEVDPRMAMWKNSDPAGGDLKRYVSIEYRQKPEDVRDDIGHPVYAEVIAEEPRDSDEEEARHLAPFLAGYKAEVGGAPHQPEKKEDQISPVETEERERLYLQPEKDLDDLYHKDVPVPVFDQDDTKDAAPANVPPQSMYSEPEVDLDHIYHK